MIITLRMGVMYMLTIGLLTALGLAVGASFGKALGVAVGSYLVLVSSREHCANAETLRYAHPHFQWGNRMHT